MKELNNEELLEVCGGAISTSMAGLITGIVSGVVVFLAGILNGYLKGTGCK